MCHRPVVAVRAIGVGVPPGTVFGTQCATDYWCRVAGNDVGVPPGTLLRTQCATDFTLAVSRERKPCAAAQADLIDQACSQVSRGLERITYRTGGPFMSEETPE
jgi:hypothetical protein